MGQKDSLQYLGRGAEERDGSVTAGVTWWLIWFWNWDDYGVFPYCRDVGMVNGKVKKISEVLQAKGTKVAEVQDGEAIRSSGTRIATIPDGPGDYGR